MPLHYPPPVLSEKYVFSYNGVPRIGQVYFGRATVKLRRKYTIHPGARAHGNSSNFLYQLSQAHVYTRVRRGKRALTRFEQDLLLLTGSIL